MPYLNIETNLPLSAKAERVILRSASSLVASELNKSEEFVMVSIHADVPMLFAGTDEPVAMLELKALALPARKTHPLSAALCHLIEEHLGIPPARVYVKFISMKHGMWGWNGSTFGTK